MKSPRFLIVRRDNIGDLVCTTPLIAGIRNAHPNAWIGVVANSYNAPALEGNPDIDAIYAYRKAKHGEIGALGAAWARIRMLAELRRLAIDYAIVATPADRDRGLSIAGRVRAKHVVAFVAEGAAPHKSSFLTAAAELSGTRIDIPIPLRDTSGVSEVELVWRIAAALGIDGPPPPARVVAPEDVVANVRRAITHQNWTAGGPLVAIHISARKASQRWDAARFAAVMHMLHERHGARFIVLWAPGSEASATHPGDDAKARALSDATAGLPVLAWPTHALRELIGALAACDAAILADGGAMHIAAALGKPLVVLYGDSDPRRWRPWGARHEALQAPSRDVKDIQPADVADAFARLATDNPGSGSNFPAPSAEIRA